MGWPSAQPSKAQRRFEREVELAAKLEHPNIARVYDSGLRRGIYYYAMELVKGAPLDRFVRDKGFSHSQILTLMVQICRAVHYAHQHRTIHLDLKPSNILVTPDGVPKLLDFGLARALSDGVGSEAITREIAGTPRFMAPEQAVGDTDRLEARTDVYTLGSILYQLLTGSTTHCLEGPTLTVLRRIAEEDVRPPRLDHPEVDKEVEAILLKALCRDPEGRYSSAAELAEELENFLAIRPIKARPHSTWNVLVKWARRHRVAVAWALAAGVLAAAGTGLYLYRMREAYLAILSAKYKAENQRTVAMNFAWASYESMTAGLDALNTVVFLVERDLGRDGAQMALRKRVADSATVAVRRVVENGRAIQYDAERNSMGTADPVLRASADRTLAASLFRAGEVYRAAGDVDSAASLYAEAIEHFERVAKIVGDRRASRELMIAHVGLGKAERERRNLPAAHEHFDRAQELQRTLSGAQAPGPRSSPNSARDDWVLADEMVTVRLEDGGPREALEAAQTALRLVDEARRLYPKDFSPGDRSISLKRLADVHTVLAAAGDVEEHSHAAADALSAAEAIDRAAMYRAVTPQTEHDLAATLSRFSLVQRLAGREADANATLCEGAGLMHHAVTGEPHRPDWQQEDAALREALDRGVTQRLWQDAASQPATPR
jgi:tetratricopeptide (TPR) repeat protein